MKKIFILFASVTLSIAASAQQVPNGGFENWNDSINPIGWNTFANGFGPAYCRFAVKDTSAQAHVAGLVTLRMKTDTAAPQGITRSFVGLGTISVAGAPTFSGTPYTRRPDTLYMAYAYFAGGGPSGADSGLVQIDLLKAGTSIFTAGVQTFWLPPSNGGYLAFPLTSLYANSTDVPDLLKIVFKSSKSATGAEFGSTLYLDEVHFDASVNVTGIQDIGGKIIGVNAYPNPANNAINIAVESDEIGSQLILTDLTGRVVYNGTITSDKFELDTRNFASGVYSIRVNSTDKMATYKGKISITH